MVTRHSRRILLAAGKFIKEDSYIPTFVFSFMSKLKIGAVKGAPLEPSLRGKKIVPVFFSHGLTSAPHNYCQVLMDLARNGMVVFAINH